MPTTALEIPGKGLLPASQFPLRLTVKVKVRHAIGLAGVEVLEREDDVGPFPGRQMAGSVRSRAAARDRECRRCCASADSRPGGRHTRPIGTESIQGASRTRRKKRRRSRRAAVIWIGSQNPGSRSAAGSTLSQNETVPVQFAVAKGMLRAPRKNTIGDPFLVNRRASPNLPVPRAATVELPFGKPGFASCRPFMEGAQYSFGSPAA